MCICDRKSNDCEEYKCLNEKELCINNNPVGAIGKLTIGMFYKNDEFEKFEFALEDNYGITLEKFDILAKYCPMCGKDLTSKYDYMPRRK